MNSVVLKGRLTADPELKNTANGIEYCTLSVAVDRYMGKDKEKSVDFIPCKAWRQTAVFINKYFAKGQEILISGAINVDKYDKDGETRTFTSVAVDRAEFCGKKGENGGQASAAPGSDFEELIGDDGELPF